MTISRCFGAAGMMGIAGFNSYNALGRIMEYTSTKSIILEKILAENPELTKEIYNTSERIADNMASGDLMLGLASSFGAGLAFGVSLYLALNK